MGQFCALPGLVPGNVRAHCTTAAKESGPGTKSPAHPDASKLVSPDSLVTVTYLLPNVTSLTQPMDQGVLEMLKRKYRKSLVRDLLLSEDDDVTAYLNRVNMLTIAKKSAAAWDSHHYPSPIPGETAPDTRG